MKFLIAGLGNIGKEYGHTRHNIGFEILDFLAGKSGIFFSPARYGDIAELKYRGRQLILLKPSTFMNLSGKAISYWLKKEEVDLGNLLVLTDDLALPFGKIRLRSKGSDGGHNGLKNITEALASDNFARLRFGIGSEFLKGGQVDFVLSKWTPEEAAELTPRLEICADAVKSFSFRGIQRTMSDFNNR